MFIDVAHSRHKGKTYRRVLLRDSYREGGKVKHRTIANLSHCSDEEIAAMRLAFKHKKELAAIGQRLANESAAETQTAETRAPAPKADGPALRVRQGLCAGAVAVLHGLSKELGIAQALGDSRQGKLALWQVIARVIDQGSRLSAARLAQSHAACDLLGLDAFNEDDLYRNLKWLCPRQREIEDRLFETRCRGGQRPGLFLYDVTSSYLEGEHNELAAFGYNRDGKGRKRQIVIGLLCDDAGTPLSVEVFPGNTPDTATFASQVKKAGERFGNPAVTLVGDRGMIKGPQINEITANGLHYITAITKPQIKTLLKDKTLQMELFDQPLAEVEVRDENLRYILRRNPERAEQMAATRQSKIARLKKAVAEANDRLANHPRARPGVRERDLKALIARCQLGDCVTLKAGGRVLTLETDPEKLREAAELDGCYVIKTDLTKQQAVKETVHERYKDLSHVESGFRTCKTGHLEMRPVHVRLEESTRAHILIVMLAYILVRELARRWSGLNLTVEEGIRELSTLCFNKTTIDGQGECNVLPVPRPAVAELIRSAAVAVPEVAPCRNVKVDTRKKLQKERKGG